MLGSFATKFLAGLLVLALWSATISVVMNQTVLSSHYVEHQLDANHGYDRLSTALTDEIAHSPDLAANPDAAAKVQQILNSGVLKTKINGSLEQLQAYMQGKGPQPTIDLTDLATQAQAAGIPIEQGSSLTKPIPLGPSVKTDQQVNIGQPVNHLRTVSLVASVVLALGLLALSYAQKRYTALPNVLIVVGVLIGVLALSLLIVPGIADHFIKFGAVSNAFVSLGHDLTASIARDLGKRFGIIAAVYLVIGIVTRILAQRLRVGTKTAQAKAV
jgi:multisubunit Na+/H+ antiporter MnhB subunit